MDHAQASLDRVLRSGEYVCRPHRQIFVEHTFFNDKKQITRQVTKDDLVAIAGNGNGKAASTGDLSPIGIGHTADDVLDAQGNVVRKFAESEQPQPIGYLHNYSVEQRGDGKWALYADEWIKRSIPNDKGQMVDGVQYAETFPRRSAEYYPQKKWIDWLALLRRAPALPMGLDLVSYQAFFPERICYRMGTDGARIAGLADSHGKWRYAEDCMDDGSPASPASAKPVPPPSQPSSGGQPGAGDLPPDHQAAAQHYGHHYASAHMGMHHTHVKALLHAMHAMHGASLGLNPDKMTPHTGQAPTPSTNYPAQPVNPGAAGAPPGPTAPPAHQQHSPVWSGDEVWQKTGHSPPGPMGETGIKISPKGETAVSPHEHNAGFAAAGNTFIPAETGEKQRMSQTQANMVAYHQMSEMEKVRYDLAQVQQALADATLAKNKADYDREITELGYKYALNYDKEMERGAKWNFDPERCKEHIQVIKDNYGRAPVNSPNENFVMYSAGLRRNGLPSRTPDEGGGVSYEESEKAKKYIEKNGGIAKVSWEEALEKVRGS